jgi:hypothetical protein
MPGFGSLAAGRRSGYFQAALALGGLALTMVFGVPLLRWYVANWSRLYGAEADPSSVLNEIWPRLRWPLAGFVVFAAGWLWSLGTSLQILREAKDVLPAAPPPLLRPGSGAEHGIPPKAVPPRLSGL